MGGALSADQSPRNELRPAAAMLRDARAAASHTDTYTRTARGAPPRGALPGVQGRGRGAMCRLHRGGFLHAALRGVGAGLRTLSRGHGGRGAPKASQAPRGASPSRAAPRRSAAAARRPAAAPRSRRRPRAPRRRPRTHPPCRARRVRTGGAQGGDLRARAGVGTRPRRTGLLPGCRKCGVTVTSHRQEEFF